MKTTHTPAPWSAACDKAGRNAMALVITGASSAYSRTQAIDCTGSGISYQQDCANADFIVNAVNCHDELLAALQDAEFLLRKIGNNPLEAGSMVDSCKRSAEDARAAIAKAVSK